MSRVLPWDNGTLGPAAAQRHSGTAALKHTSLLFASTGYYADQLSVGQELRGNLTVQFKNESRGFHLNNLSYAGPIIMGCGGEPCTKTLIHSV